MTKPHDPAKAAPTDDELDSVTSDVEALHASVKPKGKGGVAGTLANLDADRILEVLDRVLEMFKRLRNR